MANEPKPATAEATAALFDLAGCELAGWSDPARRLRQALDQDELRLFCQPIVSLDALARCPPRARRTAADGRPAPG